ncbi:MAG: molybdopterin-guanine dinucleotide biosynthesis protein B [Candidatus Thorarchaeota archaeon]
MRVFAVSGYSGTGKTTLIEAIIKSLVISGHSVATIKSSIHKRRPSHGTDTWRHMQAGASTAIFIEPSGKSGGLKDRVHSDELAGLLKYEFLIIEGMKSADIPKFWCIGDNELDHDDIPVNTQAVVSWSNRQAVQSIDIPIYTPDEIDALVEIVKTRSSDISEID